MLRRFENILYNKKIYIMRSENILKRFKNILYQIKNIL